MIRVYLQYLGSGYCFISFHLSEVYIMARIIEGGI